jgi:hypothetical protein
LHFGFKIYPVTPTFQRRRDLKCAEGSFFANSVCRIWERFG